MPTLRIIEPIVPNLNDAQLLLPAMTKEERGPQDPRLKAREPEDSRLKARVSEDPRLKARLSEDPRLKARETLTTGDEKANSKVRVSCYRVRGTSLVKC